MGAARLGEQARERIAADPASAEAMALVAAVEAARTDETVLVCDMAVAGYWVGGYASAPGPRRLRTRSAGARSASACPPHRRPRPRATR